MQSVQKVGRRRILIISAAFAVTYLAYRGSSIFFAKDIKFEPLAQPHGFRMVARGQLSTAAFGPLTGLDGMPAPDALTKRAQSVVDNDFCAALFESDRQSDNPVRIATFSDYYCPYCRILIPRLAQLATASGSGIKVAWHEWPILGEASRIAARAALAARRQGAYLAFQSRMMKASFQPTPAYLADLCRDMEIDFTRLQADMMSDHIDLELAVSAALADRFGFIGTPDLVIGKTVLQGDAREQTVRRLIEIERQEGLGNLCTTA